MRTLLAERLASADTLHERIARTALEPKLRDAMTAWVTMRKYECSLAALPEQLTASGTSRSSVSRRFVAPTAEQVRQYLSRPLDEIDLRSS